ncbi:MAG: amino acid dehydrogenase [Candidatus Rokubacteria bacterium]|nr:amino acid dehydrogenase [Candidatus Rokubacteria bacterium]
MKSPIFDYLARYGFKKVVLCQNNDVGLRGIIAIHSTNLGPATGGLRMWTYDSEEDAIMDALRLARGMTYKYAAAGVSLGGGKAVIIGDPRTQKTEGLLRAVGRFIQSLHGEYQTGEDVGITLDDLEIIHGECDYVVTLPEHAGGVGPIGPATAVGVLEAMKACCEEVFGSASLKGRRVALQGLGAVGWPALELLLEEGAKVVVADIDRAKVDRARRQFRIKAVAPEAIYAQPCDVVCPCALGAIINDRTIRELRCKIVCGSANNQLAEERHGDLLEKRGILYAPDYIANAGGTILDTDRLLKGGFNRERAMRNVARIGDRMRQVIEIAKRERTPTSRAADRLAEERLAMARSLRMI